MAGEPERRLRISADLNSVTEDGWCWMLRVDGRLIDEVAHELKLREGMAAVIFDDGDGPEYGDMEYDAILSLRGTPPTQRWMAQRDEASFRRVKREPAAD
jgi:hypothetical protein